MNLRSVFTILMVICMIFSTVACTRENGDLTDGSIDLESTSNSENTLDSSTMSSDQSIVEPPFSIAFDSIEQLVEFASCTAESDTAVQKYTAHTNMTPSQILALAVALSQAKIPIIKDQAQHYELGICYFCDYQYLEMIYIVDEIQYRFTYDFDQTTLPVIDKPIAIQNAHIDTQTVNFYKTDSGLYTQTLTEKYLLTLSISTTADNVDLDIFVFQKPSNMIF